MKEKISLAILIMFVAVSCPAEGAHPSFVSLPSRLTLPQVTEKDFLDNSVFRLTLSETVELMEWSAGGEQRMGGSIGKTFYFPLSSPLSPGEEDRIYITVRTPEGRICRLSFLLAGKNPSIPRLLINEVSHKGTSSAPDRVELIALSQGDTAGVVVETQSAAVTLPSCPLRRGDIVLIYWDRNTTLTTYERDNGGITYVVNGCAKSTIAGPEGVVVVREEKGGRIMDALIYSEKGESAFDSAREKEWVELVKESGEWTGDAFDSSLTTSSRVMARLPGAVDTDSAEDWFVTAPRTSTFGRENEPTPYMSD